MLQEHELFDGRAILSAMLRRKPIMAWIMGSCVLLALCYIIVTPARYTAEAKLLIDPHQAGIVSDISPTSSKTNLAEPNLESQVAILTSRALAGEVAQIIGKEGYCNVLLFEGEAQRQALIDDVLKGLHVSREGESYVINVRYSAGSPEEAARSANLYAEQYIHQQVQQHHVASGSGAQWLSERIAEIKEQSSAANQRVQNYRLEHNMFTSGGRLINEDQMIELNSELGMARAQTATAKARHQHSLHILKERLVDAAVAEALDNEGINNIRTRYLSSKKRLYELERNLGERHRSVVNLREEILDYEDLIFREMERTARSQQTDYDIARARETALEESLERLIGVKSSNDMRQSELGKLEKEAAVYDNLYADYMQKYETLKQQESFLLSDTRIISAAIPPLGKSHPKTILLLGLSIIFGMGMSVLAALLLESQDKSLRTIRHVRDLLGLGTLGYMPLLPQSAEAHTLFDLEKEGFTFTDAHKTVAIDEPQGLFAETMRKTKLYIDERRRDKGSHIIGVISSNADEGKTSVATNLATSLANAGESCLLIDLDVRNPAIRKDDFTHDVQGLGALFEQDATIDEVLIRDTRTGLAVLPAVSDDAHELVKHINQKEMGVLLAMYSERFDYIIIDLPPLSATADVESVAAHIQSYVLVAKWGVTPYEQIKHDLADYHVDTDKIMGVVLTHADMEAMVKYYQYRLYPKYHGNTPVTSFLTSLKQRVLWTKQQYSISRL